LTVGLLAAVAWPAALIGMASVIDNPWSVCTQRSMLAGRQLAEVLLSRQQVNSKDLSINRLAAPPSATALPGVT